MLDLIKVIDGKPTPYNLDQFGRDHNTTGRQDKHINPHGVFRVRDAAKPEVTSTQKLVAWALPKLADGVWSNGYDVVEMSGNELAAALAHERAAMQMSREKFAVLAAGQDWITEAEAEDWVAGNVIPSIALEAINSRPEGERFKLRLSVRAQNTIHRNDMLIVVLMTLMSVWETEMDELFRNVGS